MRLWGALYVTIWLVLLEVLFAMIPVLPTVLPTLHAVLGVGIVAVAYWNFTHLRSTTAPGRLKRTARATFALAVLMVVLGGLLLLNVGTGWMLPWVGVSVYHAILFVHIVNAFAILTQAAAVAVAFDMWEEREFERPSAPGELPPPPSARPPSPVLRV
jgi:hypothetical protein